MILYYDSLVICHLTKEVLQTTPSLRFICLFGLFNRSSLPRPALSRCGAGMIVPLNKNTILACFTAPMRYWVCLDYFCIPLPVKSRLANALGLATQYFSAYHEQRSKLTLSSNYSSPSRFGYVLSLEGISCEAQKRLRRLDNTLLMVLALSIIPSPQYAQDDQHILYFNREAFGLLQYKDI